MARRNAVSSGQIEQETEALPSYPKRAYEGEEVKHDKKEEKLAGPPVPTACTKEMRDLITSRDARISEIKQRVATLTTELSLFNSDVASLKEHHEPEDRYLARWKKGCRKRKVLGLRHDAD